MQSKAEINGCKIQPLRSPLSHFLKFPTEIYTSVGSLVKPAKNRCARFFSCWGTWHVNTGLQAGCGYPTTCAAALRAR
jgi:hypothetical protein